MFVDDETRLQHMLQAAQQAQTFVVGKQRGDLEADAILSYALVHVISIIGEAAARITPETRLKLPNIPWQAMIAMRNRLIHAYFSIDLDLVWNTVSDDLPPLINELMSVVKPMPPAETEN